MLQPWLSKAIVQSVIALLPNTIGDYVYYTIQKRIGRLTRGTAEGFFRSSISVDMALQAKGRSAVASTFLEVGTGRTLNLAIGLWLLGANKVYTVDLHRYLRFELVKQEVDILKLAIESEQANNMPSNINSSRLAALHEFIKSKNWSLQDLFKFINVEYFAPQDAANLELPDSCIDYHISFNVLEHIPQHVIMVIFKEALRILKKDGLTVHSIDFSDHFAHADKSITQFNFLKYTDSTWQALAGNRFMYANRLRLDDFQKLFDISGIDVDILWCDKDLESYLKFEKENKLSINFQGKDMNILATLSAMYVGSKK